jgi:Ca-activated chloride channel family protein
MKPSNLNPHRDERKQWELFSNIVRHDGNWAINVLKEAVMRISRIIYPLLLTLMLTLSPMMTASADGIIIPEPPICQPGPCPHPVPITQLAIEYHHVEVQITDQVATTRVDQVFRNDNDWTVEGTYIFPIPVGAAVDAFTLWIDGEPVEGEILDRDQARGIYEEIVRTMRDPALLEYVDRQAVQASIFPIPPGGERRIQLQYSQVLTADNGLIHYRYPLNTEKFSTEPLESVIISVEVESNAPVRSVYSPTHEVAVDRDGQFAFKVGYEDTFVKPDTDFDLFYSISTEDIGLNLMTYRDPEGDDPEGFFLLLASPSVEVDAQESIPKDVLVVLDKSGSMDGEKFRQAQEALRYILENLNPEDRFNLVAFSTDVTTFASEIQPADEIEDAIRWSQSLAAVGSTDIYRALMEAIDMASSSRPTILIFLTDGLPTEGVTDTQRILQDVNAAADDQIRLFNFGVGYDVDTYLLDSLAQKNRGTTTYVTPDQAIDEAVSGFFAKVNLPVLTDIELDFGDVIVFDIYPQELPDLFSGSQLLVVGRYRSSGVEDVVLRGDVEGKRVSYRYDDQRFRSSGGADFLPRLWATRKIGALLNDVRLNGPDEEIIDQIVRLSIRYGIVTPYTSYLVTEPNTIGFEAQDEIGDQVFEFMSEEPMAVTGEDAVDRAAAESEIREAEKAPSLEGSSADLIRFAGTHTFKYVDGVWMDTAYDPESMDTLRVPFLSDDYFTLAASDPEIGAAVALGSQVIVVSNDVAYEIVDQDESGDTLILPSNGVEDQENEVLDEDRNLVLPDNSSETRRGSGLSLPCSGTSLLVLFPLLFTLVKRDRN